MKILFTIIVLAFTGLTSFAQSETTEIARFIISDARLNKVDITQSVLEAKAFLVLFREKGSNTIYMSNVWPAKNTQSYGNIYNVETSQQAETSDQYKNETISFNWSYANSFDRKEGTATVKLQLVYKPVGTAFTMTMVTENLDMYTYKGYVRGSLNLLQ